MGVVSSLMLPPSSLSPGAGLRAGTPCPVRLPCARRLPCVGVAVSAGLIDGREEIVKANLDAVMLLIERSALDGPVSVQNLPHHVGREQVVRTIQGPPPVRARPAFGVVLAHRPSRAVTAMSYVISSIRVRPSRGRKQHRWRRSRLARWPAARRRWASGGGTFPPSDPHPAGLPPSPHPQARSSAQPLQDGLSKRRRALVVVAVHLADDVREADRVRLGVENNLRAYGYNHVVREQHFDYCS